MTAAQFDLGQEDHFARVHAFLDESSRVVHFYKPAVLCLLLHWRQFSRISTSDLAFINNVNFKRITVMVVFTKSHGLVMGAPG